MRSLGHERIVNAATRCRAGNESVNSLEIASSAAHPVGRLCARRADEWGDLKPLL